MIGMILSAKALVALTGYKQPSKQIAWIKKHLGIDPPVGADGYAKVSQTVVDQAILNKTQPTAGQQVTNTPSGNGPKWKVPA